MKEKNNVFERFRNSFCRLNGHFHVLEQRIPIEVQIEYFKYSEQMRKNYAKMTEEEYYIYMHSLSNETLSSDHKKYILTSLAISSDVRAYRFLEDYAQHPEADIAHWAYMALMESRISLESELLEEKQIYISTGLGGKGEKLRFYVLIIALKEEPFQEYQRQTIESEFTYYLPSEDIEIERLTIYDSYVELVLLIPVRKDIKTILDNIIAECNQYGNFLSNIITVTNVKELSADEVAEIIQTRYADKNNKAGH
ncbi:MAG: hypothetical protein LBD89_04730 [Tannerellaceae bacterium]|jgi:hypothetical protein|nr:hypothetical protein [Tannerellaceae bacterium]